MRIKLDENLPASLAAILTTLGHDVETVVEEQLSGCNDQNLWEAAQKESRFLITQDMDFSDVRRFRPGDHCGILPIRLRSPDLRSLIHQVEQLFREEDASTWGGCFVVVSDRKVRVVRPLGR